MRNLNKIKVVILGGNSVSTRIGMLLGDQGLEVVSVNQSSDLGTDFDGFKRSQTWVEGTCLENLTKLLELADVIVDAGVSSMEFKPNPATIYCRVSGTSALLPEDSKIGVETAIYDIPLLKNPRFHSLPIPSTVTACWAVIGIMAGLIARNRDGRGQVIEIGMKDASITTHELIALLTHKPPTAFQPLRWAASPFMSVHKTSNGYIYIHIGLSSHLDLFLHKLGSQGKLLEKIISPKTRKNPASVANPPELFKIQTELRKIFATRTSLEWENDYAQLCIAAIRSPEQWLGSEVARSGKIAVPHP